MANSVDPDQMNIAACMADNVDSDQMLPSTASDLGLHSDL